MCIIIIKPNVDNKVLLEKIEYKPHIYPFIRRRNSLDKINEIPFYTIDEVFQSSNYSFQTGWVKFSDLKTIDFNNESNLFFAVLPDAFADEYEVEKVINKSKFVVSEF